MRQRGFTLIEVLTVISIIALLSSVVLSTFRGAREDAMYNRAKNDFQSIRSALELYFDESGEYPNDAPRDTLPDGLGTYIGSQDGDGWPPGPYPNSVYDWDNWDDPDTPGKRIYQISLRFCPAGGQIEECIFPNETWAADFGVDSALYHCVEGACRAHVSQSIDYPGVCINCP